MRSLVLALLAICMLLLYAYMIGFLVEHAITCTKDIPKCEFSISARLSTVLHTLQGLVSAIVIAILALTPPKQRLNLELFGVPAGAGVALDIVQLVAVAYLLVWLLAGSSAFLYGTLFLPTGLEPKFQPLLDLGASWFGLAVAASYAFFGLKPGA